MKYWVPESWGTAFNHEGLLFFVQRMQEMLYHFSCDIYRAPVHNTATLMYEFSDTYGEVKAGVIKEYQLTPIFEELRYCFSKDSILRARLGDEYVDSIVQQMRSCPDNSRNDLVSYLADAIVPHYYNWSVEYLKEHIPNGRHKIEIEKGARAWIADLVMRGYTGEFVYSYIEQYLVRRPLQSLSELDAFFERFDFEKRSYKVYIQLSDKMEPYFGILGERLQLIFEDDGNFGQILKRRKHAICYFEIEALDYYRAATIAYQKINIFLKYYRFLADKRTYLLYKFGAVWEQDEEKMYYLPIIPVGFKTMEFQKGDINPEMIDSLILGIQDNGPDGMESLHRVLVLHNNALQQQLPKDGFVNLWSVLEVLCPQGNANSKIDPILYSILPVLQNEYYRSVFQTMYNDIDENVSEQEFRYILDMLPGESGIAKMAAFCFLPDYEQEREDFFAKLGNYPLLRHKIYTLYLLKDNRKDMFDVTKQYYQRVKWHFYRLYRARNAIVHAGLVPHNTRVLGEHLHSYIDNVLFEIAFKLADNKCLHSIANVFMDVRLLIKKKEQAFGTPDPISSADIGLLFDAYFCPVSNG